jgi:ActR/RegA family two-component response regulator
MFAPGVVIYEKTRRWEAILKRAFLGTQTQVRPCRLPAEMLELLGAMRGSVAVIDLSAGAAAGLRLITQICWRQPQSHVFVLAPPSLADLEWPAREFGAAAFLPDSVSDAHLGQLCRQHLGVLTRSAAANSGNEEAKDAFNS